MLNKYTITCYLDEENEKLLSETTDIYNSITGKDTTPHRMFDIMFAFGNDEIQELLSFRKGLLETELKNRQRAQ